MSPKPDLPQAPGLSVPAYAKSRGARGLVGRDPRAVREAIQNGRLVKCIGFDRAGRPRIVDSDLADREWVENTDASMVPLSVAFPENADLANARARGVYWRAKLLEFKFRQQAARLVPAADVAAEWQDIVATVRARVLRISADVRAKLPNLTTDKITVIDKQLADALEELAAPKEQT